MRQPTKMERNLGLDYSDSEKDKIWFATQGTLRKLVGILGILLPVVLWLGVLIDSGHSKPVDSISHYYFTRVSSLFVIVVSLLAFFLIVYKGDEPADFYVSLVAGLFALLLLIFPTYDLTERCEVGHKFAVTSLNGSKIRSGFHLISAGIFLASLAGMSIWLFTKKNQWNISGERITRSRKDARNVCYKWCGGTMFFFLAAIVISFATDWDESSFYVNNSLTFWFESFAVWSFGISWMIKGRTFTFLNDKKEVVS